MMPQADGSPLVRSAVLWAGRLVPVLVAVAATTFAIWQGRHLVGFTYAPWHGNPLWSDYDEGVYISSAWQVNQGQPMFSQVFSSQPLLFLTGLSLTMRLAGMDAGHLYPLICGVLALVGVAWLAWEIAGRWSALLAVAVLAVSPGFVIASYAIEAEAPMLAYGSLAVAAAGRYARGGRRRWLALAALLLAAATLSKLLAIALALPFLMAIILKWWEHDRPTGSSAVVGDMLTAAACGLAPVAAAFAFVAPREQWDQVISFHLKASAASTATDNLTLFHQFLAWDPGLMALTVSGMAVAVLVRQRLALIAVAWLLANVITLLRYQPLFVHHLTVILAPMAVLAGLNVGFAEVPRSGRMRLAAAAFVATGAALAYAIWLPDAVDHSRHALISNTASANLSLKLRAAAWLDAHSAPGATVVVDDQMIAVLAKRFVPPQLTDTSTVRCTSGYLSLATLEQATKAAQVRTVLLTRALRNNPSCGGYVRWLRTTFQPIWLPADVPGATGFVTPKRLPAPGSP